MKNNKAKERHAQLFSSNITKVKQKNFNNQVSFKKRDNVTKRDGTTTGNKN